MITVKKSEYNKAKLRKLFGQAAKQYIQITDEEAQELGLIEQTPTSEPTGEPTGNTEPENPTGNTEPQESTGENNIPEYNYEFYEDENDDLILNVLDFNEQNINNLNEHGGYKYYLQLYNECGGSIQLKYGKNIVTKILNNGLTLYKYSYDPQYVLYLRLIHSDNIISSHPILFNNLKHEISYYQPKVTRSPKFILYLENNNNYKLELIQPLIYKYKNVEYSINNINEYILSYTIKGDRYHSGNYSYLINNSINILSNTLLEFNYNFKTYYIENGHDIYGNSTSEYTYHFVITYNNNIIEYTSNVSLWLYNPSNHIDHFNILNIYGSSLVNNKESINYYIKNEYGSYTVHALGGGTYKTIKNLFSNDFYDYICQKLNCQKNVLRVYANYEYSFLRVNNANTILNVGNYFNNMNNEYSINVRKDINLINEYLDNNIINEIILFDESLLSNWQKFKLFFTANNIDYITVNCGWDVNENNEHFLINPITGEKIIVNT